jgi:hypothetical protein
MKRFAFLLVLLTLTITFSSCLCEPEITVTHKEKPEAVQDSSTEQVTIPEEIAHAENQVQNEQVCEEDGGCAEKIAEEPEEPTIADEPTHADDETSTTEPTTPDEPFGPETEPEPVTPDEVTADQLVAEQPQEEVQEPVKEYKKIEYSTCTSTTKVQCKLSLLEFSCLQDFAHKIRIECYDWPGKQTKEKGLFWVGDKLGVCVAVIDDPTIGTGITSDIDGAQDCLDPPLQICKLCQAHPCIKYQKLSSIFGKSESQTRGFWYDHYGKQCKVKSEMHNWGWVVNARCMRNLGCNFPLPPPPPSPAPQPDAIPPDAGP